MKKENRNNNKENKTEKKNKKDTKKSTGELEMEANRIEYLEKGHKHEPNKCPLGNVVNNASLVTNRTPQTAPGVQESMEGVVEATSKRKKNPESDNESSPDREAGAGERVKKLIMDTKDMKEGGEADEKEEGEIVYGEVQVQRNKNESSIMKLNKALKDFDEMLKSMQVENLKSKGHILQQMETSKNEVMQHMTSEI